MLLFSPNTFIFSTPKNLTIRIYKTIILPVVLYGCEALSLTLREERKLKVYENRVLGRIFGPKWSENVEWTRPHNDEFHSLCHHLIQQG